MPKRHIAPYGSWKSPLTASRIVAETIGIYSTGCDGEDLYWTELRPQEAGRFTVMRHTAGGGLVEIIPPPFDARTRVHEYGGRPFAASSGTLFFSNAADQRLYRLDPGAAPAAITPEAAYRYADLEVDRSRNGIFCVREDHNGPGEAVNTLVRLRADGDAAAGAIVVSGDDFYSSPRLSPDGARLAWLAWSHPNMPWDGTELWVGELDAAGAVVSSARVAGGPDESIFQPEWSPDGVLHFVSDRTDWWNLYRVAGDQVEALCPLDAEFGRPQWVFGAATYGFTAGGQIICTYVLRGTTYLARLDTTTRALEEIETPYTFLMQPRVTPRGVLAIAGSPFEKLAAVLVDPQSGRIEVLRRAGEVTLSPASISIPQAVEFPTEGGLTSHAFFYPPANEDFAAPPGEKPPLLVMSHGGPTSAAMPSYRDDIQYWTSRGIAVLDVNYGGSTGYGRAYRRRLVGQWGVVDVDDCVNGARHLVAAGEVDGDRLLITGGSAGGYTTLCALTFRDVFKAGASHFGIGDLETFAKETHKFESRYMDSLVGPYPARRDRYIARSAIHFVDRLSCPVILFQGSDDAIVPPNQARTMADALRAKGLPVAYLEFEGEQHGFRKAENIQRALEAELYFYSKVFGFALADPVEPVAIENL